MASKAMPKWLKDEAKASEWKTDKDATNFYEFSKDNFTLQVVPGLNNFYRIVISKQGKMSVSNSMLMDSEKVINLLRNPIVHY